MPQAPGEAVSLNEYGELVYAGMMAAAGPIIPPMATQEGRSSHWPKFLEGFMARHPDCWGCGRKSATGHHLKPFHLFPELELEESNIAPVCLPCHFVLCHCGNWQLWNKMAKQDLATHLVRVKAVEAVHK